MEVSVHTAKDPLSRRMTIEASVEIPEHKGDNWIAESRAFFRNEARRIVDALDMTLPGGTMHEILILLLERKANLLHVGDK